MNIVQSICTKSDCYKSGRKINPKGLMLHSVGCNQPNAQVFVNTWNKSGWSVCTHAVLQADGAVYQCLPWNHRAWHCGRSGNDTHISVEMTEPAQIKYTSGASFTCQDTAAAIAQVKGTYETAVALFAMLCKEYDLNPLTDICSHAEGYKKGIASNHGDPEHLWNQLKTGYTMDGFRKAVKSAMTKQLYRVRESWDNEDTQRGAYEVLENAVSNCPVGYHVYDENGVVVYTRTKGDVDGDGKITPADARLAMRGALELETLSEAQNSAADMDGDGKTDMTDVRKIFRKGLELE